MVKISYIMNVINGEPFIKAQLGSIYHHADEIIIVEGAYEKFRHASTSEGRSVDTTLDSIRSFPDPDKKITLIANPGFYDDRLGMCNELLKHVTGDVIWQVDVDEFFLDETHHYIRQAFDSDLELDRVSFNFRDLFANERYYIAGYDVRGLDNVNRVHRFSVGDSWSSQRPPLLQMKDGVAKPIKKHLDGPELADKGHVMFHATLIFEKQIQDKYKYYNSMWKSISSPTPWIKEVWERYENKFNAAGFTNSVTYLKYNSLEVPEALSDLFDSMRLAKDHSPYTLRSTDDIEGFMTSDKAVVYQTIASQINQGLKPGSMNIGDFLVYSAKLYIDIFFRLESSTRRFALKVHTTNTLRGVYRAFLPVKRAVKEI